MKYYHSKQLKSLTFAEAVDKVTEALKSEGFGILTQINIQETLKKKLNEDFRPYLIWEPVTRPTLFRPCKSKIKSGPCFPAMSLYNNWMIKPSRWRQLIHRPRCRRWEMIRLPALLLKLEKNFRQLSIRYKQDHSLF